MNTTTKLRGRDALGVVRRHGGQLQGISLRDTQQLYAGFGDAQSAYECAGELEAGGVSATVRPGRGKAVMAFRLD